MRRIFLTSGALIAAFGMLLTAPAGEAGQEFRGFDAIPTPISQEKIEADINAQGFEPLASRTDLSPSLVEKVVYDLFDAWNTAGLDSKLSKSFPNRSRIMDAIQTGVPRQVRLKILSIQNPRILKQYVRPHPSGDGSFQLLSEISVRVYAEAASNTGLTKRFQRVEGTSEYLIQVTQKVNAQ